MPKKISATQPGSILSSQWETVAFLTCPSPPSASVQVQVEPVGRWFEAYFKRRNRSTSASFQELEEEEESEEESEDEEFQLEEYPMLRTLDPKDWKVSDENGK